MSSLPPCNSRFAVCTFERVFDTTPKQDARTLPELVGALTRFDLKPQLRKSIARETKRIETAWAAWECGDDGAGPIFRKLEAARQDAESRGWEVAAAVRTVYETLLRQARGRAKTDLRLWSPALYRPEHKRGREGVLHLSCLVLDYDKGTRVAEASRTWERWLHVLHSTWSHTHAYPKFRVILPLAGPVEAEHWGEVWAWASGRAGGAVDPSMKGVAATYASPATPSSGAERVCSVHVAPLLDPVVEGLAPWFAEPPPLPGPPPAKGTHFRAGVEGHTYLQEWSPEEVAATPSPTSEPDWVPGDDFDWDMGAQ